MRIWGLGQNEDELFKRAEGVKSEMEHRAVQVVTIEGQPYGLCSCGVMLAVDKTGDYETLGYHIRSENNT